MSLRKKIECIEFNVIYKPLRKVKSICGIKMSLLLSYMLLLFIHRGKQFTKLYINDLFYDYKRNYFFKHYHTNDFVY